MQFRALALDYDGTIDDAGHLHPDVRTAIVEARVQGIIVVLVTGRRVDDLKHVMGDLSVFDAVVAENGAIVHFPDSGRSAPQAKPPPARFLQALRARGLSITPGTCVLEADADSASAILDEIRIQELPLVLLFNRTRLMVLPQGISKGTGLRAALEALRVSPHNAIGIGDAENDHALIEACEIGVAVSWGSPALQVVADEVLSGTGPAAVAAYIWSILSLPRLPPERTGRQHLQLGTYPNGTPFELAVRDRNVLIVGDPRSGKSWLAGLLAEQFILLGYCVCILDPEGDYATLSNLPRVVTLGGDDPPPHPRDIWRALRYPDTSIVVDLSHLSLDDKREQLAGILPVLASVRSEMGFPHRILLDEAHYFLAEPTIHSQLHLEDGGYLLATYRMDQLPPDAVTTSEVVLATRVTDPREVQALAIYQGNVVEPLQAILARLALDEAVLLPNASEARGSIQHIHLSPRLTRHVRHREKYLDVPVLARHAFVFTRRSCDRTPGHNAIRVRTPRTGSSDGGFGRPSTPRRCVALDPRCVRRLAVGRTARGDGTKISRWRPHRCAGGCSALHRGALRLRVGRTITHVAPTGAGDLALAECQLEHATGT
jgi:hydroxymethylpyrimidine pyrophosphatase-like HAD family hydrolase